MWLPLARFLFLLLILPSILSPRCTCTNADTHCVYPIPYVNAARRREKKKGETINKLDYCTHSLTRPLTRWLTQAANCQGVIWREWKSCGIDQRQWKWKIVLSFSGWLTHSWFTGAKSEMLYHKGMFQFNGCISNSPSWFLWFCWDLRQKFISVAFAEVLWTALVRWKWTILQSDRLQLVYLVRAAATSAVSGFDVWTSNSLMRSHPELTGTNPIILAIITIIVDEETIFMDNRCN